MEAIRDMFAEYGNSSFRAVAFFRPVDPVVLVRVYKKEWKALKRSAAGKQRIPTRSLVEKGLQTDEAQLTDLGALFVRAVQSYPRPAV